MCSCLYRKQQEVIPWHEVAFQRTTHYVVCLHASRSCISRLDIPAERLHQHVIAGGPPRALPRCGASIPLFLLVQTLTSPPAHYCLTRASPAKLPNSTFSKIPTSHKLPKCLPDKEPVPTPSTTRSPRRRRKNSTRTTSHTRRSSLLTRRPAMN